MIPQKLQLLLVIAIIIYFAIILKFLKDKALELKYTLLWLFAGLVMLIMVVFPELLSLIVHLFGIQDNMNGLYILVLAFVLMILMALTSIVSRQSNKMIILIQELAVLEKRIRDIEIKHSSKEK